MCLAVALPSDGGGGGGGGNDTRYVRLHSADRLAWTNKGYAIIDATVLLPLYDDRVHVDFHLLPSCGYGRKPHSGPLAQWWHTLQGKQRYSGTSTLGAGECNVTLSYGISRSGPPASDTVYAGGNGGGATSADCTIWYALVAPLAVVMIALLLCVAVKLFYCDKRPTRKTAKMAKMNGGASPNRQLISTVERELELCDTDVTDNQTPAVHNNQQQATMPTNASKNPTNKNAKANGGKRTVSFCDELGKNKRKDSADQDDVDSGLSLSQRRPVIIGHSEPSGAGAAPYGDTSSEVCYAHCGGGIGGASEFGSAYSLSSETRTNSDTYYDVVSERFQSVRSDLDRLSLDEGLGSYASSSSFARRLHL